MTDVLIAGGGPAGLAAAIALAERGVSAVVVDAAGGVAAQRGDLLPQGATEILGRLGLSDVLTHALGITDVVSHWGAAQSHAHGGHPGLGLHGWGIDRRALSLAMLARVNALGVDVLTGRVKGHVGTADGWQVTLSGKSVSKSQSARYLIDATGRPASIARRLGATVLQGSDLVALTWQIPRPGAAKMLAEATANGWWYAVPHAAGRTVGFMTSTACAKAVSRAPDDFLSTAQHTLKLISIVGAFVPPRLMDSRSTVLNTMSGPGWLATGDAAAAFDPIASQGLFNALSGGFFAGHAAADAIAGDPEARLVYEALAARTAERTHAMTHLQYASRPFDTPFWHNRAQPGTQRGSLKPDLHASG